MTANETDEVETESPECDLVLEEKHNEIVVTFLVDGEPHKQGQSSSVPRAVYDLAIEQSIQRALAVTKPNDDQEVQQRRDSRI